MKPMVLEKCDPSKARRFQQERDYFCQVKLYLFSPSLSGHSTCVRTQILSIFLDKSSDLLQPSDGRHDQVSDLLLPFCLQWADELICFIIEFPCWYPSISTSQTKGENTICIAFSPYSSKAGHIQVSMFKPSKMVLDVCFSFLLFLQWRQ
jgi:hypothetical protein